jgi:hypothetical protein
MRPISHTTASISGLFSPTFPAGTINAWLQTSDQNVRYTLDGTTPTANTGLVMSTSDPPIELSTHDGLLNIQLIPVSGTASVDFVFRG